MHRVYLLCKHDMCTKSMTAVVMTRLYTLTNAAKICTTMKQKPAGERTGVEVERKGGSGCVDGKVSEKKVRRQRVCCICVLWLPTHMFLSSG
jgi:hypothetical protein